MTRSPSEPRPISSLDWRGSGVELSGDVVDSPQALIVQQVESGVVVRMAVLYELITGGGGADPAGVRAQLQPATEPQPA